MTVNTESKTSLYKRHFTKENIHPYEEVQWKNFDAVIKDYQTDKVKFEQKNVLFPDFYSQAAINIIASKYFRGILGTETRETTYKDLLNRVVHTNVSWGKEQGYFSNDEEAKIFSDELTYILLHQMAYFNSPVWFNMGFKGRPQTSSACFINSIEDSMDSILDLVKTEGTIFKAGSGSGVNISNLRSKYENLSSGGTSSGAVSFMRGFDKFAGLIKSGGATRRAAKMVIMNVDHPEIEDFIQCKVKEEEKAYALIREGYDSSYNGDAYSTIDFQNANNSVRVQDDFMEAVESDDSFSTKFVNGKKYKKYKAKNIFRQISEAAWKSGDPGIQYDSIINKWNTCKKEKCNATNPCVTGDTLVSTSKGLIPIIDLVGTKPLILDEDGLLQKTTRVIKTGNKSIYELKTNSGYTIKCTSDHLIKTNLGDIEAGKLTSEHKIRIGKIVFGNNSISEDLAFLIGIALGDGCVSGKTLQITMNKTKERKIVSKLCNTINNLKTITNFSKQISQKKAFCSVTNAKTSVRVLTQTEEIVSEILKYANLNEGSQNKKFKNSIYEMNSNTISAILRGLFTSDGTVSNENKKGTYSVSLDSTSIEMLKQVQILLLGFGIKSKIYENRKNPILESSLPDGKGSYKKYKIKQLHSLRIRKTSRIVFEEKIGFDKDSDKHLLLSQINKNHRTYSEDLNFDNFKSLEYVGKEDVYDLTEPIKEHFIANGICIHNCAEYTAQDDTSCNLASLNLMRFFDEKKCVFDIDSFFHACSIIYIAQDIWIDKADYPTEKIDRKTKVYRTTGLGYANLGALIMSLGLPYDSDDGRSLGSALASVMTAACYLNSAKLCDNKKLHNFPAFNENKDSMLEVLEMHKECTKKIKKSDFNKEIIKKAIFCWEDSIKIGTVSGYRNSFTTVIAPTGTIALAMDCDTTGIEPELALVKTKLLAGSDVKIKFVNKTVPMSLRKLGYDDFSIKKIESFIEEHGHVEGSPELKEEHYPVFDCSFKTKERFISHMGHLKMLAAIQPFISGASSKTINMPESATIEDIMDAYHKAWKMGIKCVAIYRDNSKGSQVLSTIKKDRTRATRIKLPDDVDTKRHRFSVGDNKGYIQIGLYEDKTPGEVFITMNQTGSTIRGLMDTIGVLISLLLQYGVPIKAIVKKLLHTKFEPQGFTSNKKIRFASSVLDYLGKYLAATFMNDEDRESINYEESSHVRVEEKIDNEKSKGIKDNSSKPISTGELCSSCGSMMVRNGTCKLCSNCGATSGCS